MDIKPEALLSSAKQIQFFSALRRKDHLIPLTVQADEISSLHLPVTCNDPPQVAESQLDGGLHLATNLLVTKYKAI